MKWYRKKNKRESMGELEQQVEKLAELGAQLWLNVNRVCPWIQWQDPDSACMRSRHAQLEMNCPSNLYSGFIKQYGCAGLKWVRVIEHLSPERPLAEH